MPEALTHNLPAILRILTRYDRPKMEGFIAVAIDLLDMLDGDPDIEDDDPGGTDLDRGEAAAESRILPTLPEYGIDQTAGPINERDAVRAHRRAVLEGKSL